MIWIQIENDFELGRGLGKQALECLCLRLWDVAICDSLSTELKCLKETQLAGQQVDRIDVNERSKPEINLISYPLWAVIWSAFLQAVINWKHN